MGFPENELTSGEHVVLHLHPHWKVLVLPFTVLIVAVAAVVATWVTSAPSWSLIVVGVVALALVIWRTVIPYVKWHSRHYVFTNERVITRTGIFSRDMESIPLTRVNDVSSHQSFTDRFFGCGTLIIESAGDHGQDTFKEVPHISKVARDLHELVDGGSVDDDDVPRQKKSSHDGDTKHLSRD